MSRPRRTPPSTQTSVRPSTAATTSLEHVDRGRDPVELARPVVADDDRVDAVLDGEAGVLGGQDALEHERQRRPPADRRRGPTTSATAWAGRLEALEAARRDRSRWVGPARAREVAEARAARSRSVGRARGSRGPGRSTVSEDRAVAGRGGALDELRGSARVRLGVELEPARRVGGRGGDLLDRARRHRRQRERHAGRRGRRGRSRPRRPGGPGRGRPSARSRPAWPPASPSSVVDGSTALDVDEDPRPEPAAPPGRHVLGEGHLVPRAAGDVVVGGGAIACGPAARSRRA